MIKRRYLVWIALALASTTLFACSGVFAARPPKPPAVSLVAAGVGSGTVAGNIFTPHQISVPVGSTVTWEITSDEVHMVTFVPEKAKTPDGSPLAWPINVQSGEVVQQDGSTVINSGIIFKGTQIGVTFSEVGTVPYFCAIHPGMQGVVDVVEPGEDYTTVEEAAAIAQQESELVLSLVDELRTEGQSGFTQSVQDNGATLWTVPVGALTNSPIGPLELTEYYPAELKIKAGDAVLWKAAAPHSVTFLSGEALPVPEGGDPALIPAARPSDTYTGQGFYHSGTFALGPGAPTEFQLTFTQPGTYEYTCALHGPIGHNGMVIVEPR